MTISLGELELLLVVAPQHPLARHRAPLLANPAPLPGGGHWRGRGATSDQET